MSRWHTLVILITLFSAATVSNAQTFQIDMKGNAIRKKLEVPVGASTLHICGLTPGNTYTAIANAAFEDQTTKFALSAGTVLASANADIVQLPNKLKTIQFKAPTACVDLIVKPLLPAQATGVVPLFVSIHCNDCPEDDSWLKKIVGNAELANLSTTGGVAANSLITNTLIGGNCFDVTNITSSGNTASRGTFTNGASNIGLASGMVLCTGNVNILPGPNNSQGANGGFNNNSPDDADLATLTNGDQYDVSKIEFDFKPTANTVQFDFVFGSEEYCEYVGSQYNDVFGFFISGPGFTGNQNIALIPNTSTPVAINNVNQNTNTNYYVNNNTGSTCNGLPAYNIPECQLDGWTTVFTATANVTPCEVYHIKLAIADIGDAAFASAVFLKANSFNAGGSATAANVYPSGQQFVYECCNTNNGSIKFTRVGGDITQPLTVNFTVGGTAIPGVDYQAITSPIVIPANQTTFTLPITVLCDPNPDGDETITLTLDNPCSCTTNTITFVIKDKPPVDVSLTDHNLCGNGSVTLTPTVTGGIAPFTYLWSTNATTQSITVNTQGTHTYTVTVTDHCGETKTAQSTVSIQPSPTANLSGTGVWCTNSTTSINLNLTMTGIGPWDIVYNAAGSQMTQTFTSSPAVITATGPGTYTLVSVTSSNGCTGTVTGNVNINAITANVNLNPTDPPCFTSNNGSITSSVSGGTGPWTYIWNTNATTSSLSGLGAGTYSVTATNSQGCTATNSATLVQPPQLTAAINSSNNIDCNNPQGTADLTPDGGTPNYTFNWSNGTHNEDLTVSTAGTYTVTVVDMKNCTTTASVTITANTTLPTATIAPPQSVTCNNAVVTLDATGSSQGSNYTFTWGGPSFVCCDNTLQPQVDQGGTYTITITNTVNGCTKTASVTVPQNNTPPNANATTPGSIGCNTPTIAISGNGSSTGNNISYNWTTPDGNIVSGANTINPTVNLAGTYTIVVTNSTTGCTNSASVTVTGNTQHPTATIAPPDVVDCNNPVITLDASGSSQGGNITYNWSSTPPGGITGGGNTTNPTANQAGTYTITVTDTDNHCSSTATVTVSANLTLPTAVAAQPGILNCTTTQVTLNGNGSSTGSNFTYEWTTGGGNIVSGETTLNPVIDQPGSYTLVVTNTTNGCTKSVTVTANQNITPPNVNINPPPNIGCNTPTISLNGNGSSTGSGITYLWSTPDGNIVSGGTTLNPQVNLAGTYTLVVSNANNGCTNSASVTVSGNTQHPTAEIAPPDVIDCNNQQISLDASGSSQGGNITYNWSSNPAGGITGGGNSTNPTVHLAGTYTITVTDTDNNCTSTATVTVSANLTPPVAVAAPPAVLNCATTQISLNGTGSSTGSNFTYEWTTGGGNIVSGETTLNPVVDQPGSYTLVVTNTINGCTKSVTVNVTQNITPPNVNINTPGHIGCNTPTISLNGNGSSTGSGISYQWTTNDGNIVSGATTLTPQVNLAGTYTLVVSNAGNGCTNSASVTVTGNTDHPVAAIDPPQVVDCYNPQITLDAGGSSQGGNFTYNWSSTPAGGITSGGNTTNPTVHLAGTYTITVTDTDNNCTSTATVVVTANQTPPVAVAATPPLLTCQNPQINLNGTGSSTGPNFTYEWTTGNGDIVSGETTLNPTIDQPGTYTLLVTNTTNGCTKTVSVTVTANQSFPFSNAGPTQTLNCTHPTLQLQGNASTGAGFTFQWLANPGNFVSGQNTLTPTVNQPGTYTLLVTNSANGCTSSDDVVIDENFDTPVASIAPPGILTCADPTITIDASASTQGANILYHWTSTPAGGIVAGSDSPTPVVNKPGTYKVTITNTESGCTTTAQVIVTQDITPPTANAGPGGVLSCQSPELTLNGSGSTGPNFTYDWVTANGNIVSDEFTLHPVINAAGTYTLVVTNTDNGCTKSSSVNVTTNQNFPHASGGPDLELNCQNMGVVTLSGTGSSTGPSFTYQWTASPGHIVSGGNTLNAKVDQEGTYTLQVTNTANGCTAEDEVTVTNNIVYPVPDIQTPQQLNCNFATISINASGSTYDPTGSFLWTVSNGGHIVSGGTTNMPIVDQPGTYKVVITNQDNFCTASASVTVTQDIVHPTAKAAANGVLTCQFPQIDLTAQGSSTGTQYTYNWTTATGNIVTGATTMTPTISQPGVYVLTVSNTSNGCTSTADVTVTTSQTFPVANAGTPQDLTCAITQVTLNGAASSQGSQYAYVWSTPNGHIVSGANTLNPTVDAPGAYDLSVVNLQNGCTTSATVNIGTNYTPPVTVLAPGGVLSCTVTSLNLNGTGSSTGSTYTYDWTTVNGNFVSGQNGLNPVVNGVGTYSLLITNTVNGCTSSASTTVVADASLPTASAGLPDTLTCTIKQLTLNGNASSQGSQFAYKWTGPGITNGGTTLTPVVNQPGVYQLLVTNTGNGCTGISSVNIPQDIALPVAAPAPVPQLDCTHLTQTIDASTSTTGALFVYQWTTTPGGHIVSGDQTLTPVVDKPGTYSLLITNTFSGCTTTGQVTVTQDIVNPTANAGQPGLITCTNPTVTIGATGSTGNQFTYTWTTIDGNIASGATTLNPVADAPGTYNLLITNTSNGCTAISSVEVKKDANVPNAVAQVVGELNCIVNSLQLDGTSSSQSPNITATWSTTNGHIVSGINTLTPTVDQPGQYTLTLFNTVNNCKATSTVTVNQNLTPPVANAGSPAVISCQVPVLTLDGSASSQGNQYHYLWGTQNGHIVSGGATLAPKIDKAGFYSITVTDQTNGCTAASTVQIILDQNTPQANPGASPTLTCAVTSLSLNGSLSSVGTQFSYIWTTSNGQIVSGATTLTPTVSKPGKYTLLVTNAQNGCTAIASVDVLQNITPPVANAGATPTLTCAVTSLNLDGSGSSQGPTFSYKWSTTNGQIISGDVTTAPVIGHTGLYILTVTDQDNGCTAISQVTVVDDVVHPAAATAVAGELTCTVTSLPLSGAGSSVGNIFKYVWTTANGHIVSGDSTLSPVVNKAGKYTLLVTNTVNGCTSTSVVSVTRNITPPQVDAGADDQLTCSITQLSLAATASGGVNGVTYIWAGPGIVSGGTTPTPVINATGTYNLTVTDQYNGCTSVDNVHITPNTTAPTAIIAPPALLTCTVLTATINAGSSSTGAPFTYVWTGPGILSGANTLTPVVNQPGLYKLLITNTSNGCTTTASAQVDQNIILPTAKAGGAFELTCSIDHGFLDAAGSSTGSNFTYQWTTANGHIVDGAQTVKPKVDSVGTYLLVVLNTQTGCTSSAQVAVTRNTNYPSALKLSTDRPGCGGKTGTIQFDEVTGGVGPYVYSIDGGDHFASADTYKTLKPGTYHLVVQDVNGCEFEQSLNFPVPVEPKVTLPAEIHLAYGDPTTLTAAINIPLSQIDTIIWSPMDKLTLTAKPNVVNIRPFDDVQYTVRIVNLEGCHSEARVIVSVDDPNVWAPNVFSPNDDGVNDFFLIFAGEHTVKNIRTLQIYDRWGDQVFVAENILPNIEKVGWNGRMSGKSNAEAMTPAVFVWWAEVELESGRKILLKGDVTLVR